MDVATKLLAFLVVLGVLVVIPRARPLPRRPLVRRQGGPVLGRLRPRGLVASIRARPHRVGAVGGAAGRLRQDGRRARGRCRAADLPRAFNRQSVWKRIAIVAAGPRRRTCCSPCCCSRAPTSPACRASGRCSPHPPAGTAAAAAGLRGGDLVVAVDGVPVASWQDLRWRLLEASGRADAVARGRARPAGRARDAGAAAVGGSRRRLGGQLHVDARPRSSTSGPPLIDEVVADKPAARAGLAAGRPHRRHRRRAGALAGRRRREDQRASPAATVDVPRSSAPARCSTCRWSPRSSSAAGAASGSPACGSRSIRRRRSALAVTVRYGVVDALGAGRAQDLGAVGVHAAGCWAASLIGEASLKNISGPDHDGRLRGAVGAGGLRSSSSAISR